MTLRQVVILVALVILLFLQEWKALMLPVIDVAVSLVGTFAVMGLMGFSLNNLTLFGLVLAIGIVVDDSIVVLENIERWLEKGLPVREATIRAMNEITGPIFAITLVLSSVLLPSAFLGGITGQFFRQFALTISVSMIISAINAMTMTPARAAWIFAGREPGRHGDQGKEVLPWWSFALIGGLATAWLLTPTLGVWLEKGSAPPTNPPTPTPQTQPNPKNKTHPNPPQTPHPPPHPPPPPPPPAPPPPTNPPPPTHPPPPPPPPPPPTPPQTHQTPPPPPPPPPPPQKPPPPPHPPPPQQPPPPPKPPPPQTPTNPPNHPPHPPNPPPHTKNHPQQT